MKSNGIFRPVMLTAGFLAACAILLSQGFQTKPVREDAPSLSEQSTDCPDPILQVAPTDAIPGTAVQVEDSSMSVITILTGSEEEQVKPVILSDELARYLKILFRTVISPNAP